MTAVALLVPPIADQLDQAVPTPVGIAVAVAAWPIMLVVDSLDKHRRRGRAEIEK